MIKRFINSMTKIFVWKQGIKQVYRGENKIYDRTGGYIYITLNNSRR